MYNFRARAPTLRLNDKYIFMIISYQIFNPNKKKMPPKEAYFDKVIW